MKRLIQFLALIGCVIAIAAIAAGPAIAATTVDADDSFFAPVSVTVTEGTKVTWTNTGSLPHTVTADDGSFDSGTMDAGETYSRTFSSEGTFRYYCTFHGTATSGMAGRVIVRAATGGDEVEAAGDLASTGPRARLATMAGLALIALGLGARLASDLGARPAAVVAENR